MVTLGGTVKRGAEKGQAEEIAKSQAAGQVVADQIAVLPAGNESAAKSVDSDLDKGIEANLASAPMPNESRQACPMSSKW